MRDECKDCDLVTIMRMIREDHNSTLTIAVRQTCEAQERARVAEARLDAIRLALLEPVRQGITEPEKDK